MVLKKECVEYYFRISVQDIVNFRKGYTRFDKKHTKRDLIQEGYFEGVIRSIRYKIEIVTTPTKFGGCRLWFKCPNCSERMGVLYLHMPDSKFYCRDCLDLTYDSRQSSGKNTFSELS